MMNSTQGTQLFNRRGKTSTASSTTTTIDNTRHQRRILSLESHFAKQGLGKGGGGKAEGSLEETVSCTRGSSKEASEEATITNSTIQTGATTDQQLFMQHMHESGTNSILFHRQSTVTEEESEDLEEDDQEGEPAECPEEDDLTWDDLSKYAFSTEEGGEPGQAAKSHQEDTPTPLPKELQLVDEETKSLLSTYIEDYCEKQRQLNQKITDDQEEDDQEEEAEDQATYATEEQLQMAREVTGASTIVSEDFTDLNAISLNEGDVTTTNGSCSITLEDSLVLHKESIQDSQAKKKLQYYWQQSKKQQQQQMNGGNSSAISPSSVVPAGDTATIVSAMTGDGGDSINLQHMKNFWRLQQQQQQCNSTICTPSATVDENDNEDDDDDEDEETLTWNLEGGNASVMQEDGTTTIMSAMMGEDSVNLTNLNRNKQHQQLQPQYESATDTTGSGSNKSSKEGHTTATTTEGTTTIPNSSDNDANNNKELDDLEKRILAAQAKAREADADIIPPRNRKSEGGRRRSSSVPPVLQEIYVPEEKRFKQKKKKKKKENYQWTEFYKDDDDDDDNNNDQDSNDHNSNNDASEKTPTKHSSISPFVLKRSYSESGLLRRNDSSNDINNHNDPLVEEDDDDIEGGGGADDETSNKRSVRTLKTIHSKSTLSIGSSDDEEDEENESNDNSSSAGTQNARRRRRTRGRRKSQEPTTPTAPRKQRHSLTMMMSMSMSMSGSTRSTRSLRSRKKKNKNKTAAAIMSASAPMTSASARSLVHTRRGSLNSSAHTPTRGGGGAGALDRSSNHTPTTTATTATPTQTSRGSHNLMDYSGKSTTSLRSSTRSTRSINTRNSLAANASLHSRKSFASRNRKLAAEMARISKQPHHHHPHAVRRGSDHAIPKQPGMSHNSLKDQRRARSMSRTRLAGGAGVNAAAGDGSVCTTRTHRRKSSLTPQRIVKRVKSAGCLVCNSNSQRSLAKEETERGDTERIMSDKGQSSERDMMMMTTDLEQQQQQYGEYTDQVFDDIHYVMDSALVEDVNGSTHEEDEEEEEQEAGQQHGTEDDISDAEEDEDTKTKKSLLRRSARNITRSISRTLSLRRFASRQDQEGGGGEHGDSQDDPDNHNKSRRKLFTQSISRSIRASFHRPKRTSEGGLSKPRRGRSRRNLRADPSPPKEDEKEKEEEVNYQEDIIFDPTPQAPYDSEKENSEPVSEDDEMSLGVEDLQEGQEDQENRHDEDPEPKARRRPSLAMSRTPSGRPSTELGQSQASTVVHNNAKGYCSDGSSSSFSFRSSARRLGRSRRLGSSGELGVKRQRSLASLWDDNEGNRSSRASELVGRPKGPPNTRYNNYLRGSSCRKHRAAGSGSGSQNLGTEPSSTTAEDPSSTPTVPSRTQSVKSRRQMLLHIRGKSVRSNVTRHDKADPRHKLFDTPIRRSRSQEVWERRGSF